MINEIMGLITLLIIIIVILAIIGLGWKSFSTGVLSGFERVLEIGNPIVKNITQQTRELVNNPALILTINNMVGVFEYEILEEGTPRGKIWE